MIALLLAAAMFAGIPGPGSVQQRHTPAAAQHLHAGAQRSAIDGVPQGDSVLPVAKRERLTSAIAGRLRTILCCAVLQMGILVGVPMRPEQIRDLMQSLNQPKLAQTNPEEDPSGGRRV